ncbi:vWA domain-containing protein [uncultured Shewanella sp.]|uniref:vWA domain-containing protein n=1 Tax=uncultured Shewanella sp. TaxID=173975 RepID=UPI002639F21D|nr:vWA domain-containing protein [uncultured Shewanella sp.]
MNKQEYISKLRAWAQWVFADRSLQLIIQGDKASVSFDNKTIWLPNGDFTDPMFTQLLDALLEHEVGHLMESDFNPRDNADIASEIHEKIDWGVNDQAEHPIDKVTFEIYLWMRNLFEDVRMEKVRIKNSWSAACALAPIEELAIKHGFFSAFTDNPDPAHNKTHFLNWLLMWTLGKLRGHKKILAFSKQIEKYLVGLDLVETITKVKTTVLNAPLITTTNVNELAVEITALIIPTLDAITPNNPPDEEPQELPSTISDVINSEINRQATTYLSDQPMREELTIEILTTNINTSSEDLFDGSAITQDGYIDEDAIHSSSILLKKHHQDSNTRDIPSNTGSRLYRNRINDLAMGSTNVFSQRHKSKAFTPCYITLLVDKSNSMHWAMRQINSAVYGLTEGLMKNAHCKVQVIYYSIATELYSAKKWSEKPLKQKFSVKENYTTETASAVIKTMSTYPSSSHAAKKIILLITDGEMDLGQPITTMIKEAKQKHFHLIGVGIDTPVIDGFDQFIRVDKPEETAPIVAEQLQHYIDQPGHYRLRN